MTKEVLARRLLYFLNHKKVIAKTSKGDHYKKPEVLTSLGKCHNIYQMVKDNCPSVSLASLCKHVRIHEQDLLNILPVMTNGSYLGEKEKIEKIIAFAKSYTC